MATNPRWTFTPNRILAVAALVIFILAALCFAGIMSANGHFLLTVGLCCLAAEWVF